MGFQRVSERFPKGFPRVFKGFPMHFKRVSKVSLGFCGFSKRFPRVSEGFSKGIKLPETRFAEGFKVS